MQPTKPRALLALTLTAPLLLLAGCATSSPPVAAPAPMISPLPQQARQIQQPTFSVSASSDIEAWLQQLTPPSSPAKPASAPTGR